MNEILRNIKERRSTKCFKPEAMPNEADIEKIIEAGLCAASGRNRQSPIIVAITDKQTRDRLSAANAAVMGASGDPFYGAPAVLVVLADRSVNTYVYDGSIVMANMMLAAESLGLGSCWIHRAKEVFDTEEWKAWLAHLGAEGDYEGIGNCVIGYLDGQPKAAPQMRPNRVFYVK